MFINIKMWKKRIIWYLSSTFSFNIRQTLNGGSIFKLCFPKHIYRNMTTHNHLVRKQTLNHLAKLAFSKWLSCRSWDYPENFGICSQLDRKSKTWFFTFLNVCIFWIEQDKILISQLSPPKFRYFADQNGSKLGPNENKCWQFSNGKMSFLNS